MNINQNIGVSGEFRVVVKSRDGKVKHDTGFQNNLVLDNGIKHYLGLSMIDNHNRDIEHKNGILRNCVVGSGNTTPMASDVALANYEASTYSAINDIYGYEQPTEELHNGFVKLWRQLTYVFDGINNKNITEVGLASYSNDEWFSNERVVKRTYTLCTRALIKDKQGSPIAITVLEGELLEVTYRINVYVDIRRQTGSFTLTTNKDGTDVEETFDYFLQPYAVVNGSTHITNWFHTSAYYMHTLSWGVKESDDELDSTYDLNDPDYAAITHLDTSTFANKVLGNAVSTGGNTAYKHRGDYQEIVRVEASWENRRSVWKVSTSTYAHVHTNGIRAYSVALGHDSLYSLFRGLVVVKNRANGQGIKKNDRQKWEFLFSNSVTRWED